MKEDYPIFQSWYEALRLSYDLAEKMPKWVRSNLSDRLLSSSLDVLEAIIQAIYEPSSRDQSLIQVNRRLEIIRVLWRIAVDKRWISFDQYERIQRSIDQTGKMAGGWTKKSHS